MSHPQSHPHALASLTPREAITDTLYRLLIGMDRYDAAMFDSAMCEDVVWELKFGETTITSGLPEVRVAALDRVGPLDTTHMASNIRVDVKDGAKTATLSAYMIGQHCPPGEGKNPEGRKFLGGGEYFLDVVKDEKDGLWKTKKWVTENLWVQGDISVIH